MIDVVLSDDYGGTLAVGAADSLLQVNAFDLVILAARELQPPRERLRQDGVKCRVVYAPMDRGELTRRDVLLATQAAMQVEEAFLRHQKVLVLSDEGRNRGPLILALAFRGLSGSIPPMRGFDRGVACLRALRERRVSVVGPVLAEASYVRLLESLEPHEAGTIIEVVQG